MGSQKENPKKLYYLEYTDSALLYLAEPFQLVGFECKGNYWMPKNPNRLTEFIWPELETWQPDVIYWRSRVVYDPELTKEPDEWITLCRQICNHPTLQHTKIMAIFSGFYSNISNLESRWRQQYDFYDRGPLRAVKHAKIAKQLVGQELKGFEGIHNYYLSKNGTWNISDYIEHKQMNQDKLRLDAEGTFIKTPLTHVLTIGDQGKLAWVIDSIQARLLTYIVYVIKDLTGWQRGLNQAEMERLTTLVRPECQLLLGVNDALLQTRPEVVKEVLRQAESAGGWKIFIIEHMWFESFCVSHPPENVKETFERIVYQGIEFVDQRWDLAAI